MNTTGPGIPWEPRDHVVDPGFLTSILPKRAFFAKALFFCTMRNPLHVSTPADAARFHLAWMESAADLHTPVRVFLSLREAGHKVCLLESAEGPDRVARYSFLAIDPVEHYLGRGDAVQQELQERANRSKAPAEAPGLPPFRGGWIGYLPYEWVTRLEGSVKPAAEDPWDLPHAEFHLYETVLAFDHAAQRLILMTAAPGEHAYPAAVEKLEALLEALRSMPPAVGDFRLHGQGPTSNLTEQQFLDGVASLQTSIAHFRRARWQGLGPSRRRRSVRFRAAA